MSDDALIVTQLAADRVQEEAGNSLVGGAEEVNTISEAATNLSLPPLPVVNTTPLLLTAPTVVEQVAVPVRAADGDQWPATWNQMMVTCDRCGNVWDGNAQCLCSLEWQSSEEEE